MLLLWEKMVLRAISTLKESNFKQSIVVHLSDTKSAFHQNFNVQRLVLGISLWVSDWIVFVYLHIEY